ncbi:MAG: MFS transporter [Boseongicola sp. SB0664_bin_43]|uniref:MFS transporter n=1 Tax=Boseongicola sp. SB0664_bin_43 TaxID=2604844 RepID=A0A6B0XW13_9RHOB|nr:MFS transporter [Boseongicola sp. SB0664_bin_43]MYK31990.1 MFS transporter [Boseongicola sp. SB0670_bin_30]
MSLTREELQKAGASPELARILADRLPRRARRDLTSNPLAVTLAGIAMAAFLSTLGWLVLGITGTQTDVLLLKEDVALLRADVTLLKEGQDRLEEKVEGLDERTARIEDKLDRLLLQ